MLLVLDIGGHVINLPRTCRLYIQAISFSFSCQVYKQIQQALHITVTNISFHSLPSNQRRKERLCIDSCREELEFGVLV